MLLVSFTKGGTLHRVSIQGHQLEHDWKPYVTRIDSVIYACNSDHGGYCRLSYGRIYFDPKLFEDDFPPSGVTTIKVEVTNTTEAAAITLFEGHLYLSSYSNSEIGYSLFGPKYDDTLTGGALTTTTLNANMSSILTGVTGISSLNTTYARSSSPATIPDNYADALNIDFAASLAQSFCHLFYIIEPVAYLVDMKGSNGASAVTITEHQVGEHIYIERKTPIAEAECDHGTNKYPVQSIHPYGREITEHIYHTTQANVETALDDIIEVENEWQVSATIPIETLSNPLILPRNEVVWKDYYIHPINQTPVNITVYPIDIRYDFNRGNGWVTLRGDGEIALA